MSLTRNSKCPCKSGKKLKHCCKQLMAVRANVQQCLINIGPAHAHNNRMAADGVDGFAEMTLDEYRAKLRRELARIDSIR